MIAAVANVAPASVTWPRVRTMGGWELSGHAHAPCGMALTPAHSHTHSPHFTHASVLCMLRWYECSAVPHAELAAITA
jgi:hypothetical protein